jgi:hypothetical protein
VLARAGCYRHLSFGTLRAWPAVPWPGEHVIHARFDSLRLVTVTQAATFVPARWRVPTWPRPGTFRHERGLARDGERPRTSCWRTDQPVASMIDNGRMRAGLGVRSSEEELMNPFTGSRS